jgi:hypothetical protein
LAIIDEIIQCFDENLRKIVILSPGIQGLTSGDKLRNAEFENTCQQGNTRVKGFTISAGGYSWFQFWATIILVLPEIPSAMLAISPVLTGSSNVLFHCETEAAEGSLRLNLTQDNVCSFRNCTGNISGAEASKFTSIVQEVTE